MTLSRELSFFRALNPVSRNSGIAYDLSHFNNLPCYGHEMQDISVLQTIERAFYHDSSVWSALVSTYEAIIGCHYDIWFRGRDHAHGGAKGLLDFLILPLIARKLLHNQSRLSLVLPLCFLVEIPRLFIGLILTTALVPVVLLIHAIKLWFITPIPAPALAPDLPAPPAPDLPAPGINAEKLSGLELNIPYEFRCPLSCEIMTNPVYVNAYPEHRFERDWIERHLRQKNFNPLNKSPLSLSELSDDTALKNQIDAYVEEQLQHVAMPAITI
jgi:hypothetical protein